MYCFYNGFSGQSIFDDWYISFYNLAFTSIPLVIRAVFDQDLNYKRWVTLGNSTVSRLENMKNLKTNYPYLYYEGLKGNLFTFSNLIKWISHGVFFGIGIFLIILYSLDDQALNVDGGMADIWVVSIILYTSIIFVSPKINPLDRRPETGPLHEDLDLDELDGHYSLLHRYTSASSSSETT